MKLLSVLVLTLGVLGVVVAEITTTSATPAAPAPTPSPATPSPHMERDIDLIYAEYERKARELYIKALIDYYHAHPSRLESDLSRLTSVEYSSMVPAEVLDELHVDRSKIEAAIKENDDKLLNEMDEAEETAHAMDTEAVHDNDADTEMETSQFGRFGRFGGFGFGRFGRFGGLGFGRFGFPGYGFGFGGFGYPGYGFGWRRFGFGFGFPRFGFGFGRFGWI